MRDSRPQLLEVLFEDAHTLNHLQKRAVALLKLNHTVNALLSKPLRPWCRVANFRHGILVLETASASWLMRLRYEQSNLLSALRAGILPSLASIDIRINPDLMNKKNEKIQNNLQSEENDSNLTEKPLQLRPTRQLSEESATHLRAIASKSPQKLREKLELLASLARERGDDASGKKQ